MKTKRIILIILIQFTILYSVTAQKNEVIPDLSKIKDTTKWLVINREIKYDDCVVLNSKPGDGLIILKDFNFQNGRIEIDIKGTNEQGKSFIGLAFHGLNDSTYDAVYFRPFNFKSPDRNSHSLQYISQPEYTWSKLREKHPGVYENTVIPVPDPNGWFQASIIIEYPEVKVFVNDSNKPSLSIKQLSNQKQGWLAFWVGNNSEGWFKNLKVIIK